ncbi:transporter associated domain-containing protein, partial [Proteus mirabilis]|uniref:transporter associated domain-containing protein n=1 Tax=Proteus mirabilis TaxID=584 RepID=UPI0023B84087
IQGPAKNDPAARERFLAIMLAQANRMARLIDDLLSLSRVELNEHVRPMAQVDLVPLLGQVRDSLGPDFDPGEEVSDEVDTLGGYLTVLAGHVPVRGEVVAGRGDFEFEVVDADPRRVKRVKITRGRGLIAKPARTSRRKDEEEEV